MEQSEIRWLLLPGNFFLCFHQIHRNDQPVLKQPGYDQANHLFLQNSCHTVIELYV